VPEVICDVSPVQYLHQAGLLDILRLRYGAITIPAAVAAELREGRLRGVDLPDCESLDWMRIRQPVGRLLLPMITDLGAGEREAGWGDLGSRCEPHEFGSWTRQRGPRGRAVASAQGPSNAPRS
jgi:hypothetical protein